MQDNFFLADNPNFPLEKASDWIGRWKEAGGGFFFHPQPDGSVMVQLAVAGDSEADLQPQREIERELLLDPELKSAVITLAAHAWKRASDAQAKAQDLAAMEPKGHA